jgi:hypothetical protein
MAFCFFKITNFKSKITVFPKLEKMNITNSSFNYNNNTKQLNLNNFKNIITLLLGSCIILLTIFFNLFIILVVCINKQMQNYTNIQFAFMSLADLLVGTIAMPSLLISILYDRWPFGSYMCALWALGDFIGGNISICTLTLVSYHRLKCIRQPFASNSSHSHSHSHSSTLSTTHTNSSTNKVSPPPSLSKPKHTKSSSSSSSSSSSICCDALLPSCVIWPVIILFWSVPIVYVTIKLNNDSIKENTISYAHMNENDCFFIYSFAYVLCVDLIAYVLPIALLIYFQVSIYVALLENKKKFSVFYTSNSNSNKSSSNTSNNVILKRTTSSSSMTNITMRNKNDSSTNHNQTISLTKVI